MTWHSINYYEKNLIIIIDLSMTIDLIAISSLEIWKKILSSDSLEFIYIRVFFCSRLELMIKDKNTLTRVYGQGSLLLFNFSVVVVNESKENIERIERKVFHWSIIIIIWLIVCLQSKKNKLQLQWHSINQSNKIHESMAISIHLFD